MTDGQVLYLAFTAFYLFECIRWVPARCRIFHIRGNGNTWTHSTPWSFFRTRGGAVALLDPLPPFRIHTRAMTWPCVPHEQGLCIWDGEGKFAHHLPWETLKVRTEETVIHFTDKLEVRCLNSTDAKNWVNLINTWKTQSWKERQQSFRQLAQAKFDDRSLLKATRTLQTKVRWHAVLSHGIFWGCFAFLPFAYWRFSTAVPTFAVIGLLYLFMFAQAVLWWRHVRQDPALRPGAWLRMVSIAFFPPCAIRVTDWMSELKIPPVHPLTLLHKEGRPGVFQQEAAKLWRETRWPLGDFPSRPWDGPEVEALEAYFKKIGLETQSLEEQPSLPASTLYCPRCLISYGENVQECSDCQGIRLIKSMPPV